MSTATYESWQRLAKLAVQVSEENRFAPTIDFAGLLRCISSRRIARLTLRTEGRAMESIGVLLEGMASVSVGMASTPLITLLSVVLAILTLVVLNVLAKEEE